MEDQRREKDNPFQPISLDERLSRPVPKTRHTAHEPMMMRPGQLYGRTPFYQPAVMGSPAPTEPASPQTIPFSSFQPFGSVNAFCFSELSACGGNSARSAVRAYLSTPLAKPDGRIARRKSS